jgi:hypothetical protein
VDDDSAIISVGAVSLLYSLSADVEADTRSRGLWEKGHNHGWTADGECGGPVIEYSLPNCNERFTQTIETSEPAEKCVLLC